MRLAFIWQGFSGRYGQWQDGLSAAMKLIERDHEVRYYDTDQIDQIEEFKPDVVLYWESPVTNRGKDAANWYKVCALPFKKALLFSGGPLRSIDVIPFDLVFVESLIDADTCEREGIPYRRAFGTNTELFRPRDIELKYDAFMHATFAGWKRHELFAEAVGSRGAVAGRKQEHDTNGYERCQKLGVHIFDEMSSENLSLMISSAYCVLNTSNFEGGGQRCTLEAMACGVPVIVMSDSPKCREFIEESGGGIVCDPSPESIRTAIDIVKANKEMGQKGLVYIYNKFTEFHYATELQRGIMSIL